MLIWYMYHIQICHNYRTVINHKSHLHKHCKIMKIIASCHVCLIYTPHIKNNLSMKLYWIHWGFCGMFFLTLFLLKYDQSMVRMVGGMRADISIDSHLCLYKANNVMTWFHLWRYENFMSMTTLSGITLLRFGIPSWRGPQRLRHNRALPFELIGRWTTNLGNTIEKNLGNGVICIIVTYCTCNA